MMQKVFSVLFHFESVTRESRRLCRGELARLGAAAALPADLGFCSPSSSFHFKGLARSGSHVFLDDKLIKLDFLDEMDTKELQLPQA